ncbi:HNH endonuclease [Bacillus phage Izhevsk]|uniref:Putative homing endonuclease n=1 Tax=Bacillus phage Izhevsk TaxID=2724322 RepID=A0A6H0X6F3_9CAUD|nr:HNH endonuclease [Bacillus phage Izhevsk]QIW89910.1 putative homing endonuclease [Bacillus phage Izhevsk]
MSYIRNGYKTVYMPSHHRASDDGIVYEHIVVAEQILGRELRDEEEVHHEDENKHNNSPDNLFVFATKADHTRYHHNGIMIKVEDYYISPSEVKVSTCEVCEKSFNYYEKSQTGKYCSLDCSSKGRRKSERPNKDDLLNLIKTKSFIDIGKMYGVSDNAVRKWCKSYELPYRKKDIKELK